MDLKELNIRYLELEEKIKESAFLSTKLEEARKKQAEALKTVSTYKRKLRKEKEDVEKLKKVNMSSIMASLTGKKREKLEKEEQELYEAELIYKQALHDQDELAIYTEKVIKDINELDSYKQEYKDIREHKLNLLKELNPAIQEKLIELEENINTEKKLQLEIREAFNVARELKHLLNQAHGEFLEAEKHAKRDKRSDSSAHDYAKFEAMEEGNFSLKYSMQKLEELNKELKDLYLDKLDAKIYQLDLDKRRDLFRDSYTNARKVLNEIRDTIVEIELLTKDNNELIKYLQENKQISYKNVETYEQEIENILKGN